MATMYMICHRNFVPPRPKVSVEKWFPRFLR